MHHRYLAPRLAGFTPGVDANLSRLCKLKAERPVGLAPKLEDGGSNVCIRIRRYEDSLTRPRTARSCLEEYFA